SNQSKGAKSLHFRVEKIIIHPAHKVAQNTALLQTSCLYYFLLCPLKPLCYVILIIRYSTFILQTGILDYDIALMKIKGRIPYIWNKSVPASLPTSRLSKQWPSVGTKCIIVGWGCTQYGGKGADTASVIELEVSSTRLCYLIFRVDLQHEFCAGYYKLGKGTCMTHSWNIPPFLLRIQQGDSGNGLICKHHGTMTIAGISSSVHSSKPESFPSIFVRVTSVIDWIRTEMAQN
ncbi:hypothetical protein PHET_10219, partial [Paragonimus heterotremus]